MGNTVLKFIHSKQNSVDSYGFLPLTLVSVCFSTKIQNVTIERKNDCTPNRKTIPL